MSEIISIKISLVMIRVEGFSVLKFLLSAYVFCAFKNNKPELFFNQKK